MITNDLAEERAAGDDHDDAQRHQKERVSNDVDDVTCGFWQRIADDVDPDVLVIQQCPR